MNKQQVTELSKFLSLVLRHRPEKIGIQLDQHGWVDVAELIEAVRGSGRDFDWETLSTVVRENDKQRFKFNEDETRIRASQGHSIPIDLNLTPKQPPAVLYHGTVAAALNAIRQTGLSARNRHHVHLSIDVATAIKVGQRRGKPVILTIDSGQMSADGHTFYQSDNDVWLTDEVPTAYIDFPEGVHCGGF